MSNSQENVVYNLVEASLIFLSHQDLFVLYFVRYKHCNSHDLNLPSSRHYAKQRFHWLLVLTSIPMWKFLLPVFSQIIISLRFEYFVVTFKVTCGRSRSCQMPYFTWLLVVVCSCVFLLLDFTNLHPI